MYFADSAINTGTRVGHIGMLLITCLVLFPAVAPDTSRAQVQPRARILGSVVDNAAGQPLPNVHVFISKSGIGWRDPTRFRTVRSVPDQHARRWLRHKPFPLREDHD